MKRIVLFAVLLSACADAGDTSAQADDGADAAAGEPPAAVVETPQEGPAPTEVTFAPELGVDLGSMTMTETGLYVQVLQEGEGPQAAPGDAMGVDYTVWLSDGNKLDSSFDHQPPAPLPMVLGRTQLIDGWTEGVTGMRLGEKRRLVVPYQLAYGARGRPPQLPGYSTLVFELTLAEHTPATAE